MRNEYIIDIVEKILFWNDVLINRKELFKVLFSSPVFPSLASVSQTLSYYGLHNNAFVTDLKHLLKLKNVIVHSIKKEEGHFYILTQIDSNTVTLYDGDETKISLEEFTVIWDGVVLVVEEKENVNIKRSIIAFPFCCLVFWGYLLLYFFFTTTTEFTIDFMLDSIGFILSIVLFGQHLMIFEKTSFCQIGKNVDCNYVADRVVLTTKNVVKYSKEVMSLIASRIRELRFVILQKKKKLTEKKWIRIGNNGHEILRDIVYNTTIVLIVGNSNYEELSKINFK